MVKVTVQEFAEGCRRLLREWHEIDGCVITQSANPAKKQIKKMLAKGHSCRDIESLFNHEHMSMVLSSFDSREFEWKDAQLIAEVFASMIERRLKQDYPDKIFVVEVRQEDEDIMVV
ncbi:MAG: hypothetical protein KAV00_00790, partial [Phycisphaerae bacterium]|nr:hypothetical protein [Phycisphaerae bacterium]